MFSGEHEADPQGHPEGDVGELDPEAAPHNRHDDDDGPAAVRHQLRKFPTDFDEQWFIASRLEFFSSVEVESLGSGSKARA